MLLSKRVNCIRKSRQIPLIRGPDLEGKLVEVMRTLVREADSLRDGIGRTVVRNLKVMARMGVYLEEHVRRRYPEFPVRSGLHTWEEYLPPLSPALRKLVETYGE